MLHVAASLVPVSQIVYDVSYVPLVTVNVLELILIIFALKLFYVLVQCISYLFQLDKHVTITMPNNCMKLNVLSLILLSRSPDTQGSLVFCVSTFASLRKKWFVVAVFKFHYKALIAYSSIIFTEHVIPVCLFYRTAEMS